MMKALSFSTSIPISLAALLAYLGTASLVHGQNIVLNPGFEAGASGDADNWNEIEAVDTSTGASALADRVMMEANSGDHSLLLDVVGQVGSGPNAEIQQQTVVGSVIPGKSYHFHFSAKGEAGPGTVAFYEVSWFDGDGSDGGGPRGSATGLQSFPLTETYSLQKMSDLVAPAGADSAFIAIRVVTGAFEGAMGNAYIDDIFFGQSSATPSAITACIEDSTVVTWSPTSTTHIYQPQRSEDEQNWTNLGPAITGNSVRAAFDSEQSPFYRVVESSLSLSDDAINGGFESPDSIDPLCPEFWICVTNSDQLPTRITTDFRSGNASLQLKVQNDEDGTPNISEIQQNILNAGGTVAEDTAYRLSFWAKQISSGVSYVQRYQLTWLDDLGGALAGGIGFTDFVGGNGEWTETSVDLMAPAGAQSALIQIFASTGAVVGSTAEGEVLLDDFSLTRTSTGASNILPASSSSGKIISWESLDGSSYQVKASTDLKSFVDFGPVLAGDGSTLSVADLPTESAKFYQVVELP